MNPQKIRLVDIARTCGLSVTTVGMALRGSGTISNETRSTVKRIAEQMGYVPNINAAALALIGRKSSLNKNTTTIAAIDCPTHEMDQKCIWESRKQSLSSLAHNLGMDVKCYHAKNMTEFRRIIQTLHARGVDGIILDRLMIDLDLRTIDWNPFCVIARGRFQTSTPFSSVRECEMSKVREAIDRLKRQGHQRIGACLLKHSKSIIDDLDRLSAILIHDTLIDKKFIIPSFNKPAPAPQETLTYNQSILSWYKEHQPDAIIGFSSNFYHVLKSAGILAPRDYSFVSLNLHSNEPQIGEISGFENGECKMAEVALEQMATLLRYNRRGVPQSRLDHIITSNWIEGSSNSTNITPRFTAT